MEEKKRILIVDDEIHITTILAEGLKALGENYLVEIAHDGVEALEKVRIITYDLVLTDYMMPEMSGIVLAQHVRKISPTTQVVLMTSHGSDKLRDFANGLKLDGYLNKPMRLSHISAIVQETLENIQGEGEDTQSDTIPAIASIDKLLLELRSNTAARCVLLLNGSGALIDVAGNTDVLDIPSISALVAANFLATSELAKLLGDNSVFKSSYHESPDYNIYAYRINEDILLTVIFGAESKSGLVRYYTNKTVDEILPLLDTLDNIPDGFHLESGFGDTVNNELDQLFG